MRLLAVSADTETETVTVWRCASCGAALKRGDLIVQVMMVHENVESHLFVSKPLKNTPYAHLRCPEKKK